MIYKRKRNRLREIEFTKVDELRIKFQFKVNEFTQLLGIGSTQWSMYRKCGKVPASRYYALKDALLYRVEQQARKDIQKVIDCFM